jgi:hypothetical protein
MEYVNTKKSDNGFSPFLLIWVICGIVMFFLEGIWGGNWASAFAIYILLFFLPSLFFLDIFLWHTIGKEIIYTQDKKIIIKKVNRVRPRRKKIQFEKIEDIYLWKPKGFSKDISLMSAFWDWDKQGTLCIEYDNGCKYYIGRNLNNQEAEELLNLLKSEIPNTPANPTMKSKVIEWVVFGIVVLLIVLIAIGFL